MKIRYLLFLLLFAAVGCDFGPRFKGEVDIKFENIQGNKKEYLDVLEARLKKLKVSKYEITDIEGGFHVTMTGVKDTSRVIKMLLFNETLGFWETYDNLKVFPMFNALNSLLLEKMPPDTLDTAYKAMEYLKPEDHSAEYPLWSKLIAETYKDERGMMFLKEGSVVGIALDSNCATIDSYLKLGHEQMLFPRDMVFKWGLMQSDTSKYRSLYALKSNVLEGGPFMDNDEVESSKLTKNKNYSGKVITLTLNRKGSSTFEKYTRNNIHKGIAILYGEDVISCPIVQGVISGGKVEISGGGGDEAKETFMIINNSLQMPLFKTKPVYLKHRFEKK